MGFECASPLSTVSQFAGLAGSPTTTNDTQYLGSACSGCWSIIASMDLRSASAWESFGSAASAAKTFAIFAVLIAATFYSLAL